MARKTRYSEKLKDPRWQRKRLEVLNRDGFKCTLCGAEDSTLHVHHGYYERDYEPWMYESETLHTLCHRCHESQVQYAMRDLHYELAKVPPKLLVSFLNLINSARLSAVSEDHETSALELESAVNIAHEISYFLARETA